MIKIYSSRLCAAPQRIAIVRLAFALALGLACDTVLAEGGASKISELDALVAVVVARNPAVLVAAADARGANSDLETARWQRYPSLSVTAESRTSGASSTTGRNNTTVALTQPLWMVSGSIPVQIEGAKIHVASKKSRIDEIRYQAAERTVDAWHGAVAAIAKADVASRALARLMQFQSMMRRRVDAQISPAVELDLVSSRVQQAQADIAAAQSSLRIVISRLEQLAGQAVSSETFTGDSASLEQRAVTAGAAAGAVSEKQVIDWVEQHPSLRKARQEAQLAYNEVKVKEAERWPQLYARVQYTAPSSGGNGGMGVYVGMQYAPGAGLSSLDQARSAIARGESAMANIEMQRRELRGAFQADLSELRSASERQEMLGATGGDARNVLASYERLFIAGRRSWLDVLGAVRELQQNEGALVDTRIALIAAAQRIQLRAGLQAWQREVAP
jgi:adhesin transport system outer membrane protein